MARYTVSRIDNEWRGEPPTYEVRKNARGPSDDYYEGECMGVFDTQAEADSFAHQLKTLTLKACPRCAQKLSCTSYEQYCAYQECKWNNP